MASQTETKENADTVCPDGKLLLVRRIPMMLIWSAANIAAGRGISSQILMPRETSPPITAATMMLQKTRG